MQDAVFPWLAMCSRSALALCRKKEKNVWAWFGDGMLFCLGGFLKNVPNRLKSALIVFSSLMLLLPLVVRGQDKNSDAKGKSDPKTSRLTIVVTAGDDKQPVDNASVYVKYVTERKLAKDRKIEMNLKTNQTGTCHAPEIPRGKILIQVVAPGWKTFGEYYDLDQAEQTIDISLVRPPKWY
jgi:hypothetical protein